MRFGHGDGQGRRVGKLDDGHALCTPCGIQYVCGVYWFVGGGMGWSGVGLGDGWGDDGWVGVM